MSCMYLRCPSPRCITVFQIIATPFLAACLDPTCYSMTVSRKSTKISSLVGTLRARCFVTVVSSHAYSTDVPVVRFSTVKNSDY